MTSASFAVMTCPSLSTSTMYGTTRTELATRIYAVTHTVSRPRDHNATNCQLRFPRARSPNEFANSRRAASIRRSAVIATTRRYGSPQHPERVRQPEVVVPGKASRYVAWHAAHHICERQRTACHLQQRARLCKDL